MISVDVELEIGSLRHILGKKCVRYSLRHSIPLGVDFSAQHAYNSRTQLRMEDAMIIDTHTHLGSTALRATATELIASMDETGIERSLVFAGTINGCTNLELLRQVSQYPGRLLAVAAVSPLMASRPTVGEINYWLVHKAIWGLKFYPGYEHFYPAHKILRPYLQKVEEYGKPAIFHSGDLFNKVGGSLLKYALPIHIDELAVEMPNLKIVIAHMGYPWIIDAAQVCYKNPNVFADLSGLAYGKFTEHDKENFRHCFREFRRICPDPSKLLFGTDWPITDPADCVDLVISLAGGDMRAIMHENAVRIFGIEDAA